MSRVSTVTPPPASVADWARARASSHASRLSSPVRGPRRAVRGPNFHRRVQSLAQRRGVGDDRGCGSHLVTELLAQPREAARTGTGVRHDEYVCSVLFDHLGAAEVMSAALLDNPASLGVSRKVGYRLNGNGAFRRFIGLTGPDVSGPQ